MQDNILTTVASLLANQRIGYAIRRLEKYMIDNNITSQRPRLVSVRDDYERMLDYYAKGYDDDKRAEVLNNIGSATYSIAADVLMGEWRRNRQPYIDSHNHTRNIDFSPESVGDTLRTYVTDQTMASLEIEEVRESRLEEIHKRHYDYMLLLFEYIVTSMQWSAAERDVYTSLLTSAETDINDALLIVSAITVANINIYDRRKFTVLVNVYRESDNDLVRERALVGWLLTAEQHSIPSLRQDELLEPLFADENIRKELLETQMQLIYCCHTDDATDIISKDIMPDIINNQQFQINKFGIIEEKEEDSINDILNPDAEDEKMEKVEQAFQRMVEMQKQGSDIYFGGFSKMKRYAFFYRLANWFVPFYTDHPELKGIKEKLRSVSVLNNIMNGAPFCDSDKYSLAFALSTVLERLPESIREMLDSDEAFSMGEKLEEFNTSTYKRRLYLMDLYRFFRLYDNAGAFANPFDINDNATGCLFLASKAFSNPALTDCRNSLARFLYKKKYVGQLATLINSYNDTDSPAYLTYKAFISERDGDLSQAYNLLSQALEVNGEEPLLITLRALARVSVSSERWDEAAEYYSKLVARKPDNLFYQLNLDIARAKLCQYETAINDLYRLDITYDGNVSVKRVLAWVLLLAGRASQAKAILAGLTTSDTDTRAEDYLNMGYCHWIDNEIENAATAFASFLKAKKKELGGGKSIYEMITGEFDNDAQMLLIYNISPADVAAMRELVYYRLTN